MKNLTSVLLTVAACEVVCKVAKKLEKKEQKNEYAVPEVKIKTNNFRTYTNDEITRLLPKLPGISVNKYQKNIVIRNSDRVIKRAVIYAQFINETNSVIDGNYAKWHVQMLDTLDNFINTLNDNMMLIEMNGSPVILENGNIWEIV